MARGKTVPKSKKANAKGGAAFTKAINKGATPGAAKAKGNAAARGKTGKAAKGGKGTGTNASTGAGG